MAGTALRIPASDSQPRSVVPLFLKVNFLFTRTDKIRLPNFQKSTADSKSHRSWSHSPQPPFPSGSRVSDGQRR